MNNDDGRIVLRSFTRARRLPQIIGKIGGWYPWWGVASVTQYAAGLGVFLILLATSAVWAHLGSVGNIAVFVLLPIGVAWTVRKARIDGRGPIAAIAGLAHHLTAPNGILMSATPPGRVPHMGAGRRKVPKIQFDDLPEPTGDPDQILGEELA